MKLQLDQLMWRGVLSFAYRALTLPLCVIHVSGRILILYFFEMHFTMQLNLKKILLLLSIIFLPMSLDVMESLAKHRMIMHALKHLLSRMLGKMRELTYNNESQSMPTVGISY